MKAVTSRLVLLLALVAASFVACGDPSGVDNTPDANIATYAGNMARTGSFPGPALQGTPSILWTSEIGLEDNVPVVANGKAYVDGSSGEGEGEGLLHCLDATTGKELWQFDAEYGTVSWPTVAGDVVIFAASGVEGGALRVTLYAVDAATGKARWSTKVDGRSISSVGVGKDTIFLSVKNRGRGGLHAFSLADGQQLWSFPVEGGLTVAPAIDEGVVFVAGGTSGGSNPQSVWAVDAKTGKEKWRVPLDLPVYPRGIVNTVAVGDETVLVSVNVAVTGEVIALSGEIIALNKESGQERWRSAIRSVKAAVSRGVVLAGDGSEVVALEESSGEEIWRRDAGGSVLTEPIVVEGTVYVGTEKELLALSLESGTVFWNIGLPDEPWFFSLSAANRVIYLTVGSLAQRLVAISGSE